jgi:hypothetical protein
MPSGDPLRVGKMLIDIVRTVPVAFAARVQARG